MRAPDASDGISGGVSDAIAEETRPPSRRYVDYILFLLFLVSVFNVCDRTIVSVLVEDIKRDLALDDRQMGVVLGLSFSLTYLFAGIPVAYFADRYSRRWTVSIALLVWSGMTALSGLAQGFGQIVAARMGVGVGEAGGSPASQSLVIDYVEPNRRARAMAYVSIGSIVGLGLGVLYGGWASEWLGWRWTLVSIGVPGIAVAILFAATVREPPRRPADTPGPDAFTGQSLFRTLLALSRMPAFVALTLGATFANVVSMGRNMWEPTFLRRVYEIGAAEAGLVYLVITAVPGILGTFACGALTDRLAARDRRWYGWFPALTCFLMVPLSLGFYFAPIDARIAGVPVGFVFAFAASTIAPGWSPSVMATAQGIVPPSARAVTAATWAMVSSFVGMGIAPSLVGDLNVRLEGVYGDEAVRYSLAIVGVVPWLATACFLVLARRLGPGSASAAKAS
ncbi:MAG: MFS transporter [Deltaproteobacteria bacterium]|nr:MFS transporter [Deltaproteobacteria bacterium]